MKTGMIIVHYNDYESVKSLIDNVKNYSVLDKILIVDNNSNSDIKDRLKGLLNNKIELLEEENKGFSYAINQGSKKLIEELGECNLIISNSDITIHNEKDIGNLINYLSQEDIGVVAPTIIENNSVNRGWRQPSPGLDILMNMVYIHRKIRKKHILYKDDYYRDKISYVDVVSGAFFLIRSETLKEINFLDENVFLYYEENILAKKIKDINKKIIVVNDVDITHNHSVSIDKNLKKIKKFKLQKKSQVYFQKNYNNANILEIGLLKLTAFLSRIILGIVYFFKDIKKH